MRLLQSDLCSSYPLARAGGHRTVHSLLLHLSRDCSFDCMSLIPQRGMGSQLPEYDPKLSDFKALGIHQVQIAEDRWTFDCGYPIQAVERVEDELPRCIETFQPEVVWSNSFLALPLLRRAREIGLAAVWYIHDCRPEAQHLHKAAELGVEIIAVSKFIAHRVSRITGRVCEVIYPLITEEDYLVELAPEGFITFINPRPVKGYEIFLEVARLLPEMRFLVVEAWPLGPGLTEVKSQLQRLGNVEFLTQLADSRQIYRHTRLLLVPSIVQEGGPRVIREAQLNGIPVFGSPRGGIAEMIGEGGEIIEDYENAESWAHAIRTLFADPERYQQLSNAARKNSHRSELTTKTVVRQFQEACRRALDAAQKPRTLCPELLSH